MNHVLQWLAQLANKAGDLPQELPPRPYYAQPKPDQPLSKGSFVGTVRRVYALVQEFYSDGYLTARFGCFCDNPEPPVERELEKRLGKPHLWNAKPETVNEEDLYQFIEVFHDLASRPIRGEHHSVGFGEYEWHPTQHSQQSGQELYRWRMNQLLDATP